MYWSPVWVELMWYASIFFLENQTSSMLNHSNPVHMCSTVQKIIMGPLLSKLHNLQYYVHILPKWVSSKTNFPLLNMLTLQKKFSFLHHVSPPKLVVSMFLKFCYIYFPTTTRPLCMPTSRANRMVWTAASSSATKLSITGLPFQLIAAMSNPCSFRIMTPAPVLCKSSKTAPSKYSL